MRGEDTRKDASAMLENRSGLLEMMDLEMGNDGIRMDLLRKAKEWIRMEDRSCRATDVLRSADSTSDLQPYLRTQEAS